MSQLERNKMIETGLNLQYQMSQAEVGKELGVTQQTVARIEKQAMENFKKALKERGIDIKDLF